MCIWGENPKWCLLRWVLLPVTHSLKVSYIVVFSTLRVTVGKKKRFDEGYGERERRDKVIIVLLVNNSEEFPLIMKYKQTKEENNWSQSLHTVEKQTNCSLVKGKRILFRIYRYLLFWKYVRVLLFPDTDHHVDSPEGTWTSLQLVWAANHQAIVPLSIELITEKMFAIKISLITLLCWPLDVYAPLTLSGDI